MSKFLMRIEGVNLKEFVSDTQDLSTIRGGSLLLLNASNQMLSAMNKQLPEIKLMEVTSGASIGVFAFETEDGSEEIIRNSVSEYLARHKGLRHATFVVDVHRAGADFGDDLQALVARNRWRQMQSLSVALDDHPQERVCRVDKIRPAVSTSPRKIHDENPWVSQSVLDRRSYGLEMKQDFYESAVGRPVPHEFVWDLEALSNEPSKGNLHHKIAVIYLDGNRFGKIKDSAGGTQQEWEKFDQVVKGYRSEMLATLLDVMRGDSDWKTADGRYRLETLLWGGDEIIWVVPAWKGWQTLSHFYDISESWVFRNQPLRHAGGIVFCHHNAPIHRLLTLVRQLSDEAKPQPGDSNINSFAYEVLESFDHAGNDFGAYRDTRCVQPLDPTTKPDRLPLVLSANQMHFLKELVQILREDLPRRKLHDVVQALLTPCEQIDDQDDEARAQRLKALQEKRETAITDLKVRMSKAGLSKNIIEQMEQRFGPGTCWLHLQALWDYLT